MNNDTKLLQDLVNEYASSIGLGPLSLDEAGRCGLLFDNKFSVTVECHQETGTLIISAELGPVPKDKEQDLSRMMLEGNYYWRHTGGLGTLALVPQENPDIPRTAMLLYQTPIQSLDPGTFQTRLTDFVDTAEAWIEYLDKFEQLVESNGDHLPEIGLDYPMLRV